MDAQIKRYNGEISTINIDMYKFKNALENPYTEAETFNDLLAEAIYEACPHLKIHVDLTSP